MSQISLGLLIFGVLNVILWSNIGTWRTLIMKFILFLCLWEIGQARKNGNNTKKTVTSTESRPDVRKKTFFAITHTYTHIHTSTKTQKRIQIKLLTYDLLKSQTTLRIIQLLNHADHHVGVNNIQWLEVAPDSRCRRDVVYQIMFEEKWDIELFSWSDVTQYEACFTGTNMHILLSRHDSTFQV